MYLWELRLPLLSPHAVRLTQCYDQWVMLVPIVVPSRHFACVHAYLACHWQTYQRVLRLLKKATLNFSIFAASTTCMFRAPTTTAPVLRMNTKLQFICMHACMSAQLYAYHMAHGVRCICPLIIRYPTQCTFICAHGQTRDGNADLDAEALITRHQPSQDFLNLRHH